MPPKAAASKADGVVTAPITGFDSRETRLLAAVFISQIGPDKFDYELMAMLTGNTAGTLKKMIPPLKRKATEKHPTLSTFLGTHGTATAAPIKAPANRAPASKRRKTAPNADAAKAEANVASPEAAETSEGNEKEKPKARARAKKIKKEASPDADHDIEV